VAEDKRQWSQADTIAMALVTVVAGVIRGIHLSMPADLFGDEIFYAREACIYVYQSRQICGIPLDAVSPHPPLGKLLISLGVRALGWGPLGWRIAVMLAGTASVPLLYLLARRLLGSTRGATLAAGLLAIDFLHFVHSRMAMVDIFLPLFVVASFLFVVIDRDHDNSTQARGVLSRPWLLAAGFAAGAAIATKWVGLGALAGVAVLSFIWILLRPSSEGFYAKVQRGLRRQWHALALALIVAPSLVYILAYVPRIDGSLFALPWVRGSWIRTFAREQREMLNFHLYSGEIYWVGKTNIYVSPAWSWPLIKRPESLYWHERGDEHGRIIFMGNPLVWWTSLPALMYLGLQVARRRRNDAAVVALTGVAVLYIPFLLVTGVRSAPFLHDILPSVPFMCLALATVAVGWKNPFSRWLVAGFAMGAVALFAFFYPILTAVPLSREGLQARQWFQDCEPSADIAAPAGWCWK
jgi:dolichyl-phosphate-mannose-protein mannosyltransferase